MTKLKKSNAGTEVESNEITEMTSQEEENVSSDKMEKVIEYLQDKFNLSGKNFELIGYADKGKKITATLSNDDIEASFVIKSEELIFILSAEN